VRKDVAMKLLKPTFVNNQEKPIFSIDIHPKEPKFVTVSCNLDFPAFFMQKINNLINYSRADKATILDQ
jgi:hypothetical protein